MQGLTNQLREVLAGRVCVVGIGNTGLGDDAFGPHLAGLLAAAGVPRVIQAGTSPERWLGHIRELECDQVLLLDAMEFRAEPGAAALFNAEELLSRFPQVSTHKLSLGLLARLIECGGRSRVWLLGAQPSSLTPGACLSEPVRIAAEAFSVALVEVLRRTTAPQLHPQPGPVAAIPEYA